MPGQQELGRRDASSSQQLGAGAQCRTGWRRGEALLRLEMAAELPTPAEHLNARRALQLQLLTRPATIRPRPDLGPGHGPRKGQCPRRTGRDVTERAEDAAAPLGTRLNAGAELLLIL